MTLFPYTTLFRSAFVLSDLFGFQSPSNFVFLAIVAILLIKEFTASVEIAKLKSKVTYLVQEIALMEDERGGRK